MLVSVTASACACIDNVLTTQQLVDDSEDQYDTLRGMLRSVSLGCGGPRWWARSEFTTRAGAVTSSVSLLGRGRSRRVHASTLATTLTLTCSRVRGVRRCGLPAKWRHAGRGFDVTDIGRSTAGYTRLIRRQRHINSCWTARWSTTGW